MPRLICRAAFDKLRGPGLLVLLCVIGAALEAGEPVRITQDGRLKMDPIVAPGGEAIIFTVQERPSLWVLMKLDLASGSQTRLHPQAEKNEFEPTFASDGSRYAFIRSRGNLNLDLVIRESASGAESVYNSGGGFQGLRHPTFSPDGTSVVFAKPASSGQRLFRVDARAANLQELSAVEGVDAWPGFSPDGRELVFGSSRHGDFELYRMRADGSDVRRLTERPGRDMRPRWSPDGRQIAFTSALDGNDELYLMAADGSGARRLTDHPERDDYACWDPGGRRLYWIAERQGGFDLWQMDLD